MTNFLLNVALWSFALYGLTEIIKSLIHTYGHHKINSKGIYLFIAAKNQEDKIEGVLRSLLFRYIYGKEENIDNIFVVDLNSTDKTKDIIDIISNDYDCIKSFDLKSCKNFMDYVAEKK